MPKPSRSGLSNIEEWVSPAMLKPQDRQRSYDEAELSPGSHAPNPGNSSRAAVAPWEDFVGKSNGQEADQTGTSNNDTFPDLSAQGRSVRTDSESTAVPTSAKGSPEPNSGLESGSSAFPSFFDRGDTPDSGFSGDDRRPSVASATTVASSSSSRRNGRTMGHKLQGFFGEELPSDMDGSSSATSQHGAYSDPLSPNYFNGAYASTPPAGNGSAGNGVPQTPQPSSEVTPWLYQDPKDVNAPVQREPTGPDKDLFNDRRQSTFPLKSPSQGHKFSLHRHRTQKSSDDPRQGNDSTSNLLSRHTSLTVPQREPSPRDMNTKGGSPWRSSSPANQPSQSERDNEAAKYQGEGESGGKRSLFQKLRRSKKDDKADSHSLRKTPSTASLSLSQTGKSSKDSQPRAPTSGQISSATNGKSTDDAGNVMSTPPRQNTSQTTPRKEYHSRMSFKNRRGFSTDTANVKDPNADRAQAENHESLWNLDTDLTHMEGIVSDQPAITTPSAALVSPFAATEEVAETSKDSGAWEVPDSWAIKKAVDENTGKQDDVGESGDRIEEEDPGVPYSIRIYRPDSSFAVLSLPLNTTTTEMVQNLAKKSLIQDELDNYHIILKKNDTSRQLQPGERPIAIQKSLLEQAGYDDSDHVEDLGREDHSYLCRFNFVHAKMSGYASLEKDPGFNRNQKLTNVDLSGHNLITIPIALYKKCHEILSINLSRNLSLDVPKDFIQSCTGLREIKCTGNEASRLPASFCLATKLMYLDISNNRLEGLEQSPLDKLENLVSLKMANNKLTSIPQYFSQLRSLRHLNLSSNSLHELPQSVCEISTLVDLDVSFNMISALPHVGKLENLERLWATNNKLSGRLEDSMSDLQNLREMDVRFNAIDNIDVCSKLPQLENLMAGHNSISAFEGSFSKLRSLYLDHNPVTRFDLHSAAPSLSALSLASAKLAQLPEEIFQKISNVTKLVLDKNHFVSLSPQIGYLQKLESLSVAKNSLCTLPADIGRLAELRFLDVRENNINQLPSELWFCRRLETLNLSSNVLDAFPKPPTNIPIVEQAGSSSSTPSTPQADSEEWDKVGEFGPRRLSQVSGPLSSSTSPANSVRRGSVASTTHGPSSRKPSMLSRTSTDATMAPLTRKDSLLMNRVTATFAGSLRHLFIADNRVSDDCFDQITILQELRTLNLSYNVLYEIPLRTIRRWQYLSELYLSGNDMSSLPSEDLEEISSLKVLHINNNKFQVLPAELGKIHKLSVLDASSNTLKYNVSNWPYDWNWNCNPNLKYLNLSGNKRLEIKPAGNYSRVRDGQNLTDFGALSKLRVLGLMDVTLMIPSVPDNTEDRRVRTSGSAIGTMSYGMADCLGRNEHLSTLDFIVPRLEGHEDETLFGLFDGVAQTNSGSKIVKFLQENFEMQFKLELKRKLSNETASEPLRRTFLALNKDLATIASQPTDAKERRSGIRMSNVTQSLSMDDLNAGCVATIMYLHGTELFVSNVGDAQAVLIQSEGGHRFITEKHDPASPKERQRIRDAGGYVSRQGRLNDALEISRAFGYTQFTPAVIAAPHVSQIQIQDSDEIILVATRELWDFLTPDFIVDLARSERGDLMRAAQKLRDLAIAFGAPGKILVMMVGVSDLRKKERARYRTHSMSMGPSGLPDEYMVTRRGKRGRDATLDSKLARLDQEVDAPIGDVSLVFTDIKNSTILWETYPIAMRAAIRMHNEVMRRHLRLIGGYEVKTEGDAFIVAFPTVTSALLWTFTIQSQLLEVQWPQEILNSVNGQEVTDADGNVLFRGLSVRMGIHWGQPVCETDPVTRRMDYFGPMVNRAARISGVADGGQITVSSDFIAEVQRLLETHMETERSNSTGSEDQMNDDVSSAAIRRELRSLSSHGFEVKDLGERRLKGLENPEYIYLMYPHSLANRLIIQRQRDEAEKASADGVGAKARDSQLSVDLDTVWDLWAVSLRLEMLCSALECPGSTQLKPPETALLERTRERGGEVSDHFVVNFIEHQISRIETCITTLALRNLMRPFKNGILQQSCPIVDILSELSDQLSELQAWKEQNDFDIAPS